MTTNQLNSSVIAGKWVRVFVLLTCIGATNPSFAKSFDLFEEGTLHRKRSVHTPDVTWDSSSFRINGQRFSHTRSGWNPEDDFDFDVIIDAMPVEKFTVKANIISVEEYKPQVFIEDIYFED